MKKIIANLAGISMLFLALYAPATRAGNGNNPPPPPPPTITIDTINGNPPPSVANCQTSPIFSPVIITGQGTNLNPVGQNNQYHVEVDWGDSSPVDDGLGVVTPNTGSQAFTFQYTSPAHPYTTSGNFTITVKLYHQTPPGKDKQGEANFPLSICIAPTPSVADLGITKTVSSATANEGDAI